MNHSTKGDWKNVCAESPCPICGKPDWCSVSSDGAIAHCRRVSDGAAESKTDKAGVVFYVHRLNGAANGPGNGYTHPGHLRPPPANGAAVERPKAAGTVMAADADTLDAAYSFIISELKLSAEHREALRNRGLSDEEIDRRGYRSFPFKPRKKIAGSAKLLMRVKAAEYALENIPGIIRTDYGLTLAGPEGLAIPCRDTAGRIVALKVRRDTAGDGVDDRRYCYVSSAKHGGPGPGAPVHVPLGVAAPVELVRLTEGELKADVATVLSGVATIGTGAGVTSWRACLPVLKTLGAKTVRIAFDADASKNKHVAKALLDCIEALPDEGFAVELERWPESAGKGIDDALAAGAETEVLAGDAAIAAAKEIAAAAGVHAAGPATKTVTVDGMGEVTLTVEAAAGSKPQRKVTAKIGDVRHDDRLDVASAARRKQFAKRLAELLNAPALLDALRAALDTALVELAEAADKGAKSNGDGRGGDDEKSQATIIVELAAEWELWHTPAGDCYATIPVGEHQEHWPIRSGAFKNHLSKAFWDTEGKAANGEALGAALNVVAAMAAHDGEEYPVAIRVAEHDGSIFVDLCDKSWRAVEITPAGWSIVDEPPVRFRRSNGMLALPAPERGGSVEILRRFVNVADADWPVVVAWLVAALRPRGPYTVLALFATQGAGKTMTAEFFRQLIDPNTLLVRSDPHDKRDLAVSANANWCIAYDNLSHLPAWLSDALCRLNRGDGFGTRELWTNDDEVIFQAVRPIILTSIVELAEKSDLLDRCLPVSLPPIPEDRRRDEETLKAEFAAARPKILGALFDAVAGALRDLPSVKLPRLPRMADFAKWATAAESALGWRRGEFMAAYTRNRAAANDLALEASPIAGRLIDLLTAAGEWQGTASELRSELEAAFGSETRRPPGWPKNARGLSSHVRRLAPNLEPAGWRAKFDEKSSDGKKRLIVFSQVGGTDATSDASETPSDASETPSGANRSFASVPKTRQNTGKTLFSDANDASDANAGRYLAPVCDAVEIEEGEL